VSAGAAAATGRRGPVGVAIVGAGVISREYLGNLTGFPDVRVLGVADQDVPRAQEAARQYGVAVAGDVGAILDLPDVEIVVNLTTPAAHAEVALAALRAGKHVYGEKPLTLDPVAGRELLAEAAQRGLLVGNAPDTFLGPGLQAARRAVDSGLIGAPVAVTMAMRAGGPEAWHPDPEFLYQPGAGPLFDLGPYYLTALVALFGPVRRVAGSARQARSRRTIGSGPRAGTSFAVEVPTHVTALLDLAAGPAASATFSFDSTVRRRMFEVTGAEGTLAVPDPNTFGGPLLVVTAAGDGQPRDLPVGPVVAGRGLGVLDLARAVRSGVPHRASGALALHVLESMAAIIESARRGEFVEVTSSPTLPEALPTDWDPRAATLL